MSKLMTFYEKHPVRPKMVMNCLPVEPVLGNITHRETEVMEH